jgi:hypothetical protein
MEKIMHMLRMRGHVVACGNAVSISCHFFTDLVDISLFAPRHNVSAGSSVPISWEDPPLLRTD